MLLGENNLLITILNSAIKYIPRHSASSSYYSVCIKFCSINVLLGKTHIYTF